MSSPKPIELVYKHVDGLDISMDVYLPSDESKIDLPVVLWWHGGGLIQGTRKAITPHLYLAPERHNVCVVSADYRLAPQSRFPAILSDCASAVSFIASSSEFRNATKGRVDGTKIVVSGSSAGGWLALLAGTGIGYAACGVESPAALIAGIAAIYPITDLLDPFWTEKKTDGVNYFDRVIGHDEVAQYVDPSSVKTCLSASDSPRSIFYTYMVQEGILSDLLLRDTGISPREFSVGPQVKIGRFTPPPTYIVHGTIDTRVPYQQALDVVDAYKSKGFDSDGALGLVFDGEMVVEHGFDKDGMYRLDKMWDFVRKVVA